MEYVKRWPLPLAKCTRSRPINGGMIDGVFGLLEMRSSRPSCSLKHDETELVVLRLEVSPCTVLRPGADPQ